MGSWVNITEDDFWSSVNEAEESAIRAGMLVSGQEDPFGVVSDQVAEYYRNAIRSGPGNRLDPAPHTLPSGAVFHAVATIRFRLMTRFASELLTDDRRSEKKDAESWLKEVRRGIEKIEQPDDEPGETNSSHIEVSDNVPRREWTRRKQSGL